MIHFSRSFELFQWSAIPFATIGLVAASAAPWATAPAQAQIGDADYGACVNELIASGIETDAAAIACAYSFEPETMSSCVADVVETTALAPESALTACSRDRRPDEVATCVDEIHSDLVVDDSLAVLTLCHRSLLPERYSACVTGVAAEANYTTEESLVSCIAAGYRPENIAPTFIPLD